MQKMTPTAQLRYSLDLIYQQSNLIEDVLQNFPSELETAGFKPVYEMGLSDKCKAAELILGIYDKLGPRSV